MIVTVDTGGTKTLITAFSESGESSEFIKYPTPKNQQEYVSALKNTLNENYGNKAVEAIVIALPGIIDNGIALWCPNLGWKNFDLKTELNGILNQAPIFIENDAKLAGIAATRQLNIKPNTVFFAAIGTGIGTAVLKDGRLDPALNKSEGGHMLIEYKGKMQEWEKFSSGKAVYESYHKFAHDIKRKKTWKQIADRISRGLLVSIPLLQPDAVIIGGSIGTYFDNYAEYLKESLDKHLPLHINTPKLYGAKNSEQAVIYGCYYYALDSMVN